LLRYLIFDNGVRRIVADGFETHEQAEGRLAELVEADPEARGRFVIIGTLERERTPHKSR
jgi:hypothetical protein